MARRQLTLQAIIRAQTYRHETMKPEAKPLAIDLFSGCGGLTLGLKDAGYKVLGAIEIAPKAQETYKLNHPEVKLFELDICQMSPEAVMSDLSIKPGSIDLLAGCPPCQGFSRLRTRNKAHSVEDPRNDLVLQFLRYIEYLMPKSVMMENVPALAKDARFLSILEKLHELGYETAHQIADAADYGVPQRRKRLILLASKLCTPKFSEKSSRLSTVRDAISNLAPPCRSNDALHKIPEKRSEAVKKIISMIPKDGGSRNQLPIEYQLQCHLKSNGYNDVYGRMAWNNVSPTITSGCINPSKGRFIHPDQDRTITLREASLLQGFPADYVFNPEHGKEAIALMIGNALPPPFIKLHALTLRQQIDKNKSKL